MRSAPSPAHRREPWARKFFDRWRASLGWQRLKPFEKFAELIERHWDGIAAYSRPENKVALGSSRDSTRRSASFSAGATGCATKNISI